MSMMVSFCAVLYSPRGVLDEILIQSVSEGFPSYFFYTNELGHMTNMATMPINGKYLKKLLLQKQ